MSGRMRTTLTLDPDVAVLLRQIQRAHGRSFEAVVNDALRQGLRQMAPLPIGRLPTGPPPWTSGGAWWAASMT